MTKYNCGLIIGSLVHRAQGYHRLRDEKMAAAFVIPERSSFRNVSYCLTSRNVVAENERTGCKQTLNVGSVVLVESQGDTYVKVKVIGVTYPTNSAEEVFWCPKEALLQVNEQVWNLICAVPSPLDRLKIATDPNLCKELCCIKPGTKVRVLPTSVIGIVTGAGLIRERGPGTRFEVKLFDDSKDDTYSTRGLSSSAYYDKYYTADKLRLYNPKKSNPKDSRSISRNELDLSVDGMYCKRPETKEITEKLNDDSKQLNYRLRPGDEIIWLSESGSHRGTICFNSPIESTARVHLGGSECKLTRCGRPQTNTLPVSELISLEEYEKKCSAMPQMKSKLYSTSPNEVEVDDLLGIDQLDSCSTYKTPYAGGLKEYTEDNRTCKDEKNCSFNNFGKYEVSQQSSSNESVNSDELGVGSVVEVQVDGERLHGVIKWIGTISYGNPIEQTVAGIEMEEESKFFNDGYLHGKKYFECAPQRGYFTLLKTCKKDSRFQDSPYVCGNELKTPDDFGRAVIPGAVEPISQMENIHLLCGKFKGIQGHNNSCYLDATLFSMFTFTSVFDCLLWRPPNENDIDSYKEVQRVLREEIVNPLRKNLYVRAERVMNLRTLLDSLTSVTGLTCEEKDPEEFLTSLVAQVLKAEPFLKLSSGHEAYYYQLFVEKDERLLLPSVQQLFEQSLITSDIKLKEVPSCLIIQMPRFGKSYKMYPRILPSQILDVTDVIENFPRQCTICGELAQYECKECFKQHFAEGMQFCSTCVKTVHCHEDRVNHTYTSLLIPPEFKAHNRGNIIPKQFMELFAVLCIETSHYVAFVKCGHGPDSPWCFFDSMADRKGGSNGFNIPEMVLCPDLPMWLSDDGAQSFLEIKDDRHLPTYAKRLLCDAYMCMYQSTDIMMYR